VARELREELGVVVAGLRYLGTLENIYTYGDEMGHEIVMVYDGGFTDPALYERPWLDAQEDDGMSFRAVWLSLAAAARPDHPPVYPAGLLELLAAALLR
jgi:8-oxo-dGTP pyrophosphatase MutT (NUDIX family)